MTLILSFSTNFIVKEMKIILLTISLLFLFSCNSFASEANSEVSISKIIPAKKKFVQRKKQKIRFKKRIVTKILKNEIKKRKRVNNKSDDDPWGSFLVGLLFFAPILASVVVGIIYIVLGKVFIGILLILSSLIVLPLLFYLIFALVMNSFNNE